MGTLYSVRDIYCSPTVADTFTALSFLSYGTEFGVPVFRDEWPGCAQPLPVRAKCILPAVSRITLARLYDCVSRAEDILPRDGGGEMGTLYSVRHIYCSPTVVDPFTTLWCPSHGTEFGVPLFRHGGGEMGTLYSVRHIYCSPIVANTFTALSFLSYGTEFGVPVFRDEWPGCAQPFPIGAKCISSAVSRITLARLYDDVSRPADILPRDGGGEMGTLYSVRHITCFPTVADTFTALSFLSYGTEFGVPVFRDGGAGQLEVPRLVPGPALLPRRLLATRSRKMRVAPLDSSGDYRKPLSASADGGNMARPCGGVQAGPVFCVGPGASRPHHPRSPIPTRQAPV